MVLGRTSALQEEPFWNSYIQECARLPKLSHRARTCEEEEEEVVNGNGGG